MRSAGAAGVAEAGARDPVVAVDVLVGDGPTLLGREGAACSIWRVTDFASSAPPFCSVDFRA
jgi:hypothetical protein